MDNIRRSQGIKEIGVRNGEEYVQLWKIVSDFQITAVIGMVKFMLSHPNILETKTAYL